MAMYVYVCGHITIFTHITHIYTCLDAGQYYYVPGTVVRFLRGSLDLDCTKYHPTLQLNT